MSGSQPLWQWDWDYAIHFSVGLLVTVIIVVAMDTANGPAWVPFLMVPLLTLGGVVREKYQHDWEPLTPHQWAEGVLWGAGSLAAALVGLTLL